MALLLVQHGKSLPKDKDPEKGLSDEGIIDVKRIADAAKKYGINVSCIKHSGKKRARQTADIFASALQPAHSVQEISGINPMDDVASFADSINSGEDLMLVGHLPFMEKLVSFLITESIAKPVIKFQNGGIVCLDKDTDSHWWAIKWTLMPEIK